MIANHKQEVELMAVLRDKERERQKYTMESKVEQRRQRRLAKEREKKERQKLLEEKVQQCRFSRIGSGIALNLIKMFLQCLQNDGKCSKHHRDYFHFHLPHLTKFPG